MTTAIPKSFINEKLVGLQGRLNSTIKRIARFQNNKKYTKDILLFLREEIDSKRQIEAQVKSLLAQVN